MRTSKYNQNRPDSAPNAKESGLYYLQSRYYNPTWGRFLNADSFVSTGQGLLGNNMFAYCGNNPIIFVDYTGTFYTPGQIHDFVVRDICDQDENLTNKGTYIQYRIPIFRNRYNRKIGKLSTYGFCDFYSSKTGEAWEVKRFGGGVSCAVDSALTQLSNYVNNGILRDQPNLGLFFGGTHTAIPARYFTKVDSDGEGIYFIYYWDEGNGIIYYDYFYSPSPKEMFRTLAIGCAIILGAGVTTAMGIGAGAASGFATVVALMP